MAVPTGVFALLLAIAFARGFTKPILALAKAVVQVGTRAFETRVEESRNDELGDLSRSFNHMAGALKTSETKLLHETRVRSDLSRYLAPEVVDEVVDNPGGMRLGGERREVTIMFADIVSFTSISESRNVRSCWTVFG